jgi:hypothetical protein
MSEGLSEKLHGGHSLTLKSFDDDTLEELFFFFVFFLCVNQLVSQHFPSIKKNRKMHNSHRG